MRRTIINRLLAIKNSEGFYGIFNRLKPIFYVTNANIRTIQRNELTKKKISEKNKILLSNIDNTIHFTQKNESNIIWVTWFQGMDDAPLLVKMCLNRMQQVYSDKKIIIITSKNFLEYVKIPSEILKKWNKGIISNTHFSDILRLELLIKYGGTWIDSTVFCTEKATEEVYFKTPLFFLSSTLRSDLSIGGSSWYISAAPGNPVLILTRKLIYNYWKVNNHLSNYFLFHICFKISLESYPTIASAVPEISNLPAHLFAKHLNQKYEKETFSLLLSQSYFHKLSNKISLKRSLKQETFFEHLLNHRGNNNEYD